MSQFCVYLHKRPDGSVFYVGKGILARAFDFSPSRRTVWHKNIVAKYGRAAIQIEVISCASESEAFECERGQIAKLRQAGVELANLTSGGEGCSGRTPTEKQLAGLAKGRGKERVYVRGPATDAQKAALAAWKATEAGKAHLAVLAERGKERLHAERAIICEECGVEHKTHSAKARFCGRLCEQRNRRARQR